MRVNDKMKKKIFSIKYFCGADNTFRYFNGNKICFTEFALNPSEATLYTFDEALKAKKELERTHKSTIFGEAMIFPNHGIVSCDKCSNKCGLNYKKRCFDHNKGLLYDDNRHIEYCKAKSGDFNKNTTSGVYQVFDSMKDIYCDHYESR